MTELIKELCEILVSTNLFEGEYPFEYFNKLQSTIYPLHKQNTNCVISASTSSGKTICGELFIGDTLSNKKKAIYLAPMKALTEEKLHTWSEKDHWISKHKLEILTGDHKLTEAKKQRLQDAEIIIMTSEMLDTKTRFSKGNDWLNEVGLVVVDEAHLLTTNRGASLEVGLMRFSAINPAARLVLLSATMSNYSQIGNWIEKLNGKETHVISSDWRPVDLHHNNIRTKYAPSEALKLLKVLTCADDVVAEHLVSTDPLERDAAKNRMRGGIEHKKTMVFVHTKSAGRELERQLKAEGIEAEFHNADLNKAKRNSLEKRFSKDLDVLISTSTLAWGVNLMARSVVIMGDRRGGEQVSDIDLHQSAGRAGRFGMYERGDVYLINCKLEDNFKIKSQLGKMLAFHIVAEIANGTFNTLSGALEWLDRSFLFSSSQYRSGGGTHTSEINPVADTFANLIEWKCIQVNDAGTHTVTALGKIARDLYLDPEDIYTWNKNFTLIEKKDLWEQPAAIAWAICDHMKTVSLPYTPQPLKPLVMEFKQQFGASMRTVNDPYIAVAYYRLIRENYDSYMIGKVDAFVAPQLQMLLRDSGRIFGALTRISKLNSWDRERDMEVFKARIVHGVGEHLMELVQIPGIGGTIATQLYKAGLKSLKDVVANKDKLGDYIARKGNVTRILNGLKELE